MTVHSCIKVTCQCLSLITLGFCIIDIYAANIENNPTPCNAFIQLDFDTAVHRTLEQSFTLSQEWNETQEINGLLTQVRLPPNPAFSYALQTSQYGWKDREEAYAISQLIEWGGKRQKQIKMATCEYYAALAGYEASKLERLNYLSKTFIQVVAAQELAQLAMKHRNNAQEELQLLNAKVEAGKTSLIQQSKAQIALSLAEINLKKVVSEFKSSKNSLAILWSSSSPDFDTVVYPFFDISIPSSLDDYLSKLSEQPEVAQAHYQLMAAYHHCQSEKAARIPDATLTLGYGYNQGSRGIIAGIMIPLPILDQNQGNIQKAHYELLKNEDKTKQLKLYLANKLSNTYLELKRHYQEVEDLKNLIIQPSEQALNLVEEGYHEGKMEYSEVLSAREFFLEAQEKYIQALVNYHNKRADIDYLTGSP